MCAYFEKCAYFGKMCLFLENVLIYIDSSTRIGLFVSNFRKEKFSDLKNVSSNSSGFFVFSKLKKNFPGFQI